MPDLNRLLQRHVSQSFPRIGVGKISRALDGIGIAGPTLNRDASVTSPKDCVSNPRASHDGGEDSFSLARLDWEGEPRLAKRWNVAGRDWDDPEKVSGKKASVGMPSSHGNPVWLVLPDNISKQGPKIWNLISDTNRD